MKRKTPVTYKIAAFKIMAVVLVCHLLSCDKMDASYKVYTEDKDLIYVGKTDLLQKYPGRNRIKLGLKRPIDPKAVSLGLFWNNGTSQMKMDIPADASDTIFMQLNDMPEGSYTFDVFTYNSAGKASVKSVIPASVYGEQYESTLLNRSLKRLFVENGNQVIEWYAVDSTSVGTELIYTDLQETSHTVEVKPTDVFTPLPDIKRGSNLQYRTKYKPDAKALDIFYSVYTSRKID